MTIDKDALKKAVDAVVARFASVADGKNADYIPALAQVPSKLFGVAVVLADGTTFEAGDSRKEFAIE